MRAKTINEGESGYYPAGAENDPGAPWNQSDPDIEREVELNQYGEVELIERNYTSREPDNEDYEDETTSIDPYFMDKFLAEKFGLNFEELQEEGEGIEIEDIEEPKPEHYILITKYGNVEVDFDDLLLIAQS